MKTFMAISLGAGYLGGLLLAIYLSKRLLKIASDRLSGDIAHKNWVKILGTGFGAASLIPAIFLATVIGGNFGGGLGGMVSNVIGLGEIGIPIGLAVGLILVTSVTITIATAVGAGLGSVVMSILGRESTT